MRFFSHFVIGLCREHGRSVLFPHTLESRTAMGGETYRRFRALVDGCRLCSSVDFFELGDRKAYREVLDCVEFWPDLAPNLNCSGGVCGGR